MSLNDEDDINTVDAIGAALIGAVAVMLVCAMYIAVAVLHLF